MSIAAGAGASSTALADDDNGDDDDGSDLDAVMYPSDPNFGQAVVNPVGTLIGQYREHQRTSTTAHGEALWDTIYADGLEMQYIRDAAIGSIENDATMIDGYLRLEVAEALVTYAQNEDYSQSDTEDEMLAILEDEVSDILVNLYNLWTTDYLAFMRRLNWVVEDDTGDIDHENIFSTRYHRRLLYDDGERETLTSGGPLGDTEHSTATISNFSAWEEILDEINDAIDEDSDTIEDNQWDLYDTDLDNDASQAYDVPLPNDDEVTVPSFFSFDASSNEIQLFLLGPVDLLRLSEFPDGGTALPTDFNAFESDGGLLIDILEREDVWHDYLDDQLTGSDDPTSAEVHYNINTYDRVDDGDTPSLERAVHLDSKPYLKAFNEIYDTYEDFSAEIMDLADTFYDYAEAGEVNAAEIATGSASVDVAEEEDDWQAGAGYYRGGQLAEADSYVILRTQHVRLQGALFATDRSGVDFEIGEWIDPETMAGEFHISAEVIEHTDELPPEDYHDEDAPDPEDSDFELPEPGDVVQTHLAHPFKIEEAPEADDDTVSTDESDLFTPDDDPEDIAAALIAAYESEQESRDGDTEVTVEKELTLPGMPSNPLDDTGTQLLGLGLIGMVVLTVVGIVTDVVPFLGD